NRCHCLNHFQTSFPARTTKRLWPCTVKKIQRPPARWGHSEVLPQHTVQKRDDKARISTGKHATIDLPRNSCPHFRRVRVALSSLSDAEVGRIGVVAADGSKSSKQPSGMVVWGRWGFGGQIRFAGRRVARLS